jgi:hypothetical protein
MDVISKVMGLVDIVKKIQVDNVFENNLNPFDKIIHIQQS